MQRDGQTSSYHLFNYLFIDTPESQKKPNKMHMFCVQKNLTPNASVEPLTLERWQAQGLSLRSVYQNLILVLAFQVLIVRRQEKTEKDRHKSKKKQPSPSSLEDVASAIYSMVLIHETHLRPTGLSTGEERSLLHKLEEVWLLSSYCVRGTGGGTKVRDTKVLMEKIQKGCLCRHLSFRLCLNVTLRSLMAWQHLWS